VTRRLNRRWKRLKRRYETVHVLRCWHITSQVPRRRTSARVVFCRWASTFFCPPPPSCARASDSILFFFTHTRGPIRDHVSF
jgi:hypothetical protein